MVDESTEEVQATTEKKPTDFGLGEYDEGFEPTYPVKEREVQVEETKADEVIAPAGESVGEQIETNEEESLTMRKDYFLFVVNSDLMKQIIGFLRVLVVEAKFVLNYDGIDVKVVDPSHVGMGIVHIPRDNLREYVVNTEGMEISFDLERVPKLKQGDVIRFSRAEGQKMEIELQGLKQHITLQNNDYISTPKIPAIHEKYGFTVSRKTLEPFMASAINVSDSVRMVLTHNSLNLLSINDGEKAETTIQENEGLRDIRLPEKTEKIASSYPLEYLSKAFKAGRYSTELTISFDNDYPLTMDLTFPVATGKRNGEGVATSSGKFLLAPRMEQ